MGGSTPTTPPPPPPPPDAMMPPQIDELSIVRQRREIERRRHSPQSLIVDPSLNSVATGEFNQTGVRIPP